MSTKAMLEGDSFQKFMFDECHIRGEIVRLSGSFQQAIQNKQYPSVVRKLLAEATTATLLMTGTLKFEGHLSLHARGQGPLTLLMAEATNTKHFRTIANFNEDLPDEGELRMLLGKAQLAITIDPEKGRRYQGIVPLEDATMAECLARYFELSEQLQTHFMFASDEDGCYGLLLQQLPDYKHIEDQDAWDRIRQLSETLGFEELKTHSNAEILHRLYHEEKVSVYEREEVQFKCSCSEERSLASIQALGAEEALNILEEESVIQVDCQFCGQHYEFDRTKINTIFDIGKPH
jgi:molecular chaperone Hsp33